MNMSEENLSMPRCDIDRLQNEIKQLKELLLVCRKMLKEYQFSEGDFTIGEKQ